MLSPQVVLVANTHRLHSHRSMLSRLRDSTVSRHLSPRAVDGLVPSRNPARMVTKARAQCSPHNLPCRWVLGQPWAARLGLNTPRTMALLSGMRSKPHRLSMGRHCPCLVAVAAIRIGSKMTCTLSSKMTRRYSSTDSNEIGDFRSVHEVAYVSPYGRLARSLFQVTDGQVVSDWATKGVFP